VIVRIAEGLQHQERHAHKQTGDQQSQLPCTAEPSLWHPPTAERHAQIRSGMARTAIAQVHRRLRPARALPRHAAITHASRTTAAPAPDGLPKQQQRRAVGSIQRMLTTLQSAPTPREQTAQQDDERRGPRDEAGLASGRQRQPRRQAGTNRRREKHESREVGRHERVGHAQARTDQQQEQHGQCITVHPAQQRSRQQHTKQRVQAKTGDGAPLKSRQPPVSCVAGEQHGIGQGDPSQGVHHGPGVRGIQHRCGRSLRVGTDHSRHGDGYRPHGHTHDQQDQTHRLRQRVTRQRQ
jgi:hypothetical protein